MGKPKLTKEDRKYAASLNKRLRERYGEGMTAREVGIEMQTTSKTASTLLNRAGFHQFIPHQDTRYSTDEVTALLTYRWHKRMKQLRERTI